MDNETFKKRIIQLQPSLQKVAESILNDADQAKEQARFDNLCAEFGM